MIQSSILFPTGIEPDDFEPTINQIQTVDSADVLVYCGSGIENWITKINNAHKIDASEDLSASHTARRNMTLDPQVWLNPLLSKKEVENISDRWMTIDLNNKYRYSNNAKNLLNELDNLDKTIITYLESCKKRDFITFHNSFSYFAKQHGLNHNISNAGAEAEVTPRSSAEIINIAKSLDLKVTYPEDLMDSRYASVFAQEIPDGKILVLSPIAGLTKYDQEVEIEYIDKMNENIKNLPVGLEYNQ